MKKVKLKLTFDELQCFVNVCQIIGNLQTASDLEKATIAQLWYRLQSRVHFAFKKSKTVALTVAEGIAVCNVSGKVSSDFFGGFALAVMVTIYSEIKKQIA
ncbi:MAG: hypothetical protein KF872_06060 [Chitinophagales bacterium]|nr:hypothetical protein [Chitinophagales bacterium]